MARSALLLGLSAAVLCLGAPAQTGAGRASASVTVSVRLNPPSGGVPGPGDTGSGLCGSSANHSTAVVGCAAGASTTPLQVMAFTNRGAGPVLNTFDVYAGSGRIMGWRVISLNDRDYLEMTLGW